ncbi:BZ3500_MvSof-1268-A1-R1_Chr2-1g04168 [Microbotryum saponariae]|uniref:BZ3500_MvSof-1268-A1-R1_Chr2-1g04168 protein n=1 Tax=Microbotryum saponariae TaxID=289078 RepID=A0A2X0MHV5_9BASI|nr:BZ3500_MvSof-1268-A1-R1_Chr2-1g04168 [Microbotryum saponariae]SCZ91155.1 BZ3501_MvSof-1269-A2-R1_Chr2-1g03824 [Microbotryum saponariae]
MVPSQADSYFGTITTVQDAQVILEASKQGILPRVTRRLTDDERIQFVKPGACFCWEEEEAGIRRWTDHIKWTPSRVSGAFLTYLEVPSRGDETIIKQSFSSIDPQTNSKMHLIAYNSKAAQRSGTLRSPLHDPMLQAIFQASFPSSREGGNANGDLPRRSPSASSSSSSSSAEARSPPVAPASLPSLFGPHPSFSAAKLSYRRSHSNLHEVRAKGHSATEADQDWHTRERPSTANSDGDRPPLLSSQSFDAARFGRGTGSVDHTSGSSNNPISPVSILSNVPPRGSTAWTFAYPGIASTTTSGVPRWDSRDPSGAHQSASTSSLPIPSRYPGSSERPEISPTLSTHGRSRSSTSSPTSLTQPSPLRNDSLHGSSQPPQVPTPPGSAGTSRQLAPYNELASGMTSTASPPSMASLISPLRGTFLDDDDEHEGWNPDDPDSERGPRLPDQQRGSEDERQLRLLDRRI